MNLRILQTVMLAAWLLAGFVTSAAQADEVDSLNAVVRADDASLHEKAVACKRLAAIGNEDSIAAVTPLLYDETLSHYARFTLEPMPYAAADEVLREALGVLEGNLRIGVMDSLGKRRDAGAIEALAELLAGGDAKTAGAAAAALGQIGTTASAAILREALSNSAAVPRDELADAVLVCAETLLADGHRSEAVALFDAVREADLPEWHVLAGVRGAILARGEEGVSLLADQLSADDFASFALGLGVVREFDAAEVTELLLEAMAESTPARQALLIVAMADRGDRAVLDTVAEAAVEGSTEVRLAALEALGRLGDASMVDLLVRAAAGERELAEAAAESLVKLPGAEIDEALCELLDDGDAAVRCVVIAAIGQRQVFAAVPDLLEAVGDAEESVRLAALEALGETAPLDEFEVFTERVVDPQTDAEGEAARSAIRAAITRMPDRDATAETLLTAKEEASEEGQVFFLEVLGTLGGSRALEGVTAAARSPSEAIQDAATRVLGEWLGTDAAPALLDLARTGPERFRVRCLRGYIRIIRQFDMPEDERIMMSRRALAAANRDEERGLVLEVLERYPAVDGLRLAIGFLNRPALREDAAATAVAIGEKLVQQQPDAVGRAMEAVLQAGVGDELAGRARNLRNRARR